MKHLNYPEEAPLVIALFSTKHAQGAYCKAVAFFVFTLAVWELKNAPTILLCILKMTLIHSPVNLFERPENDKYMLLAQLFC